MDQRTRDLVRGRAGKRCEYCRLLEDHSWLRPFHIEHIIPTKHRGGDGLDNLALACDQCNLRKGSNLSGLDPDTNALTRLFNPRIDQWAAHFEGKDGHIRGRTEIGRTTVWVLHMNTAERVALRRFFFQSGEAE